MELLDIPVKAGNDANVAAMGEMWLGAGMGEKTGFLIIAAAMSGKIASPSFSVWVGISHLSRTFPSVENNPIFTVVPPTSTPKQYFIFYL